MRRLSKAQVDERGRIVSKLRATAAKVEKAITACNEMRDHVQQAVDAYNELVQEAETYTRQIAEEIESHFQERSEQWQGSDRGQANQDWMDQWSSASFDAIDVDVPEEIDVPDFAAADTLEELASEPDA